MSQFTRQTILDSLPHRPPFLFVDEIRDWTEEKIVTAYRFKEDEFFFKGHYPERPIVPGVILCESAMQAGAIFLSRLFQSEKETGAVGGDAPSGLSSDESRTGEKNGGNWTVENSSDAVPSPPAKKKVPVVGRMEDIRFKKMIAPGEEILCEVTFKEKMTHVYFMTAKITSDGKLVARFDFACTQTSGD